MRNPSCLLELHYLPGIPYVSCFKYYNSVHLDLAEHYKKGSFRNRALISGPNGVLRLSVPLQKGKHQQMPVAEVRIAYDEDWQRQHWRSLKTSYSNAPFFEHYQAEFKELLCRHYTLLKDLNLAILTWMLSELDISPGKLTLTRTWHPTAPAGMDDLRDAIQPGSIDPLSWVRTGKYSQVFESRFGFQPGLSALDLLFCMGPASGIYLEQCILSP